MAVAYSPKPESIWGFPKLGVPFLGFLIIKIIIFLGSILGSPNFGKLP